MEEPRLVETRPNELHRDLLGISGMNFSKAHDSASREQMFGNHLGQYLVVSGATERYIQTGMEREFGRYTFNTKMPADGTIRKLIERYPRRMDSNAILKNPQTIVIIERADTGEFDMIDIRDYTSLHSYFGFPNVKQPAYRHLVPGNKVREGEVFLDSPSITESGGYKYGVQCNMAYMSHPSVSEDGIMICEDFLRNFKFCTYETRAVEWGKKRFPLNLYGDENNYKPFPDIGDYVREDGLLMALRDYNDMLSVVQQNVRALRQVDPFFDTLTYVPFQVRGKVVDIRVHHDPNLNNTMPEGMDEQPRRYDRARREFYQTIYQEWQHMRREKGGNPRLSPELHQLVMEAISVVGKNSTAPNEPIYKTHRNTPLDSWRVEFVIEYEITPTDGFKLTDCHGGKGVICKIAKPEEMPVDENGNRADIVMDGMSTNNRMNLGRLYELYINAASRDVRNTIAQILSISDPKFVTLRQVQQIQESDGAAFTRAWDHLMGYYQIVSPKTFEWLTGGAYAGTQAEHLHYILSKFIYVYMPPDHEPELTNVVRILESRPEYKPTYGPVSYVGNSGNRVTTHEKIRIGSMYMLLLEKIADDWTACPSGKWQHFGVLSQVSGADKYSQPSRTQAIRADGEAEVRIYVSYVGGLETAERLDRNNNPVTHRAIVENILRAEKPTAIDQIVNREEIPLGGSKPLQLVKHIAEAAGWRFRYDPPEPQSKQGAD